MLSLAIIHMLSPLLIVLDIFTTVAASAQRLDVVDVIRSTFGYGYNMILCQRFGLSASCATALMFSFQHLPFCQRMTAFSAPFSRVSSGLKMRYDIRVILAESSMIYLFALSGLAYSLIGMLLFQWQLLPSEGAVTLTLTEMPLISFIILLLDVYGPLAIGALSLYFLGLRICRLDMSHSFPIHENPHHNTSI